MNSGCTHGANIAAVTRLAGRVSGCDLLALPEVAGLMNRNRAEILTVAFAEDDDPFIAACRELAVTHEVWIHIGSQPVREGGRLCNRSLLIDSEGVTRCRYDKIHLFDVSLPGKSPIRESATYRAGSDAVMVTTPWGLWGMTVCYDLRFPNLFQEYARRGASIVFVPSAFTVATGRAHWESLLRARAIETGCWIVAAAQCGTHADGRRTHGHAMIVDPWGTIVLDLGRERECCANARIDMDRVTECRNSLGYPANERRFTLAG